MLNLSGNPNPMMIPHDSRKALPQPDTHNTLYVLPQIHCLSVVCSRGKSWQCDNRVSWLPWSWRGPKHLRINKRKSNPQKEWENVCKSEKGQVSRIHRELLQCNHKKTKTQLKKGQKKKHKKPTTKRRFCSINSKILSRIILTKPQREWIFWR